MKYIIILPIVKNENTTIRRIVRRKIPLRIPELYKQALAAARALGADSISPLPIPSR
jgi:hypothetical protein